MRGQCGVQQSLQMKILELYSYSIRNVTSLKS